MKMAERQFRSFQRTRDPRALGKVFDRTAAVLWRVAVHLTGDQHEAEDLVQNTFLTAIEKAQSWDSKRPLLPWLVGIQSMLAREARRKANRALDPERLRMPADKSPEQDASRHELEDALGRALDQLPEPYRETLKQHLVEGMSASEIASHGGLRQGTVRMQIHRGLSQLKVHLPRGLSTAGIALVMSANLRASLRAKVLSSLTGTQGVAVAGVTVVLPLLGVMAMKKVLVASTALAVVVLAAWWTYDLQVAEPDLAQEVETPAARRVQAPDAGVVDDTQVRPSGRRLLETAKKPSQETGRVRIRVVNDATGQPVPGLQLDWSCRHILYGQTDANGSFEFEDQEGKARISIGTFTQRTFQVVAGETREATVHLPSQLDLELEVVDPEGKPVPKARILGKQSEYGNFDWGVVGHADEQGVWKHKSIRNGLSLAAAIDGRVPSPAVYLSSSDGNKISRRLVLGARATRLAGAVLDADGKPCAGARVVILCSQDGSRSRKARMISLEADQRGRFETACAPPGTRTIYAFTGWGAQERFSSDRRPRHWGQTVVELPATGLEGVDVQLMEGASVVGRIRAPQSGGRVRGNVSANLMEPVIPLVLASVINKTVRIQENGHYRIQNLLPGKYRLVLSAGDQVLEHRVRLVDRQKYRWDPTRQVTQELRLRLTDMDGLALPSWWLTIRSSRKAQHETMTDGDGRCHFAELSPALYSLVVFSPRKDLPVHTLDLRPGPGEQVIRIPKAAMPTAHLRGRIVARGVDLSSLTVRVRRILRAGPLRAMATYGAHEISIDAKTGRFSLGPIAPGRYGVEIGKGRSPLGYSGPRDVAANADVDVGDVVVGGPSSLRVVERDSQGKPLMDFVVYARHPRHQRWERLPGEFDGQGFVTKRIPPLTFEIRVSSPTTVPVFRTARIEPSRETKVEVTGQRATPCAFTLKRDAKSIQSARIRVLDDRGITLISGPLNQAPGYQRLESGLAPGPYTLEVHSGKNGKVRKRSRITVPEQEKVFEVLIQG